MAQRGADRGNEKPVAEVNAHSTPQWNYTPEGVLASSPQVGLGGAGLGLRSSELYLKYI